MNFHLLIGLLAGCFLEFLAIFTIYFRQKRLRNTATRYFEYLLFSVFFTVFFDFISYFGVYNKIFDQNYIAMPVYQLYSIAVMLSFYLLVNYCYILTYGKHKNVSKVFYIINTLPFISYICLLVILLCSGSLFFYDSMGRLVFSRLPSWWMLVSQIVYFLTGVFFLYFYRSSENLLNVWLFNSMVVIEFATIAIVTIKTYYTLTSFFLSFDILILFITTQYPKSRTDRISGCFDRNALSIMFEDYRTQKKNFYMLTIQVLGYRYLQAKYGHTLTDKIINILYTKMPKDTKVNNTFKYNDETFVTLTTNYDDYVRMISYASNHLTEEWDIDGSKVEVSFVVSYYSYEYEKQTMEINKFFSRVINYLRRYTKPACINVNEAIPFMEREAQVIASVRKAILNNSFLIYIQPIWSIKNKKFEKGEVLIRLVDEKLGFIPPDEFIRIAEEWHLIKDVTHQVIEKALQAISKYNFRQYGIKNLNINLSSLDLSNEDIFIFLTHSLEKYELPYSCLTIEVTETAESENETKINSSLTAFHEKGFSLALDDYGTGYSNMERILSMPFDYIKIDKNMLVVKDNSTINKIILRKNIEMLKECGYTIVVEGVETETQAEELERLNVDYIQGYYYAKPMPLKDFVEFLKENQNS